jgi:hypothetical protein
VDTMENGVGSAAKELDSQLSQLSSQMWVTFQSIGSIHLDLARWMAANIELALDTSDRYREVPWILIEDENVWKCHTLWSVLSSRWALPQLFLPSLCGVASEAPHRPCVAMQPSICLIGHAARLSLLKLDYCSLLIFWSSQNETRRDVMTPVRKSFRMVRIFQVSELFGSRILN